MQRISDYFRGKKVFVTGGTGFLGQALLEKILFACPEVDKIYVLIRAKHFSGKNISAQERMDKELYNSSAFDRLKGVHGDGLEVFLGGKLVAVPGDISCENLGIDPADLQKLQSEVEIVFNSAALVSFDAPLDQALSLNVLAAKRTVEFARACNAAVLVHVSTAYVSGATNLQAAETMYHSADADCSEKLPVGKFTDIQEDIRQVQAVIENVYAEARHPERDREFEKVLVLQSRRHKKKAFHRRQDRIETLRASWIQEQLTQQGMSWARKRGWNDTYTYTKAMGEQLVAASRGEMPTVILRPAIIESSLSEPCPGWLDGLRMADPLITAIGKGRLKALPLDPDVPLDLVPVDVVVNAILASVPRAAETGGLEIFQVATGSQNPITLGELYDLIFDYFRKHPMLDKKGLPISIRRLRFLHPSTFRLQHRLRAVPLNTAERTLERLAVFEGTKKVRRRIAAARTANQRLYYYGEIYGPYLNLVCRFQVDRTLELFGLLDQEEQEKFNFDVTRVNWRHYIQNVHIPGIKKFILKVEGAGTMELTPDSSALPFATINDLVDGSSKRFADKVALQVERRDTWDRYRYKDLREASLRIGARLQRLGMEKGDRVVLFSENQPEWGLTYLGSVRQGLVVVPIDSQTWHQEAWSVARFTGARAILASEKCFNRLGEEARLENECSANPILLLNVNRLCQSFRDEQLHRSNPKDVELEEAKYPPPLVKPDDMASIIFTTGTMADPRGAVHTHRNFLANLFGVNHNLPVQETDSFLSVLPLYHALEFTCGFLMPIYGGATVTYATTLKPRGILATMRATNTTCMLGVPTLYSMLRDYIDRKVLRTGQSAFKAGLASRTKQLSRRFERRFSRNIGHRLFPKVHDEFGGHVRVFVSGGSALGEKLFEDFKALGIPIYEGYGLTETAPVLTVNPLFRCRSKSAGRPLPGVEIRLDHPDKDGVGEIVVRSPSLMREYYGNTAATSAVMEKDWFHTGDLGWVDIDGYIYITGRTKDVIVTGAGKNVYPIDLEAIYSEIAGIKDVGVVGIKNGLTESVHAVIEPVLTNGDLGSGGPEEQIQTGIRSLAKELPSYHRIQHVHFWREGVPRDREGAIDRKTLRARLKKSLDPPKVNLKGDSPIADGGGAERAVIAELSRLSGIAASEIDGRKDIYTDLGLDSLRAIEFLLFAEDQLNVSIPDDEAAQISKVADLLELVVQRKGTIRRSPARGSRPTSVLPFQEKSLLDRLFLRSSFGLIALLLRKCFGLKVKNGRFLPSNGPYILAANHSSHLDTAAIIVALRGAPKPAEALRLHILGARDYFFGTKVRGWLVSKFLNVVPIERHESSLATLKLVKEILSRGEPVLIFPEGTRSRDGRLHEFKAGLGLIAWEMQVPIVPAHIEGTYEALPPGRSWPRWRPLSVTFNKPISMEEYQVHRAKMTRDEIYRFIAQDVRARLENLRAGQGP
jgi:long-chain acyl-CoA synthetase